MAPKCTTNLPPDEFYWEFIDAGKDTFSSERWQNILMDCSKNELLALVHVYRTGETTMSRIAEYVNVPLNTATGIANRLEKRGLVQRWRSEQDKRVMVVRITSEGTRQIAEVIATVGKLIGALFEDLSEEEQLVLLKVLKRLPALLERAAGGGKEPAKTKAGMKRIAIE